MKPSCSPVIVDNVAGVMPPPLKLERAEDTNLDQAEDDAHIAHNENGPEGKNDLQDDDQNPDGEVSLHLVHLQLHQTF